MILLRIVLFLFFLPVVFLALRRIGTVATRPKSPSAPVSTVRDPVCGIFLDPHSPSVLVEILNRTPIHFCSSECRDKYLRQTQNMP